MYATLWIAVGSGIGGAARYWLTILMERMFGDTFPWGTLAVNVSGSVLIGVFVAMAGADERITSLTLSQQFITLGIFGGFTTFSAFSLQTLLLMQSGNWVSAGANIAASLGACLLGIWAGQRLGLALALAL